MWNISHVLFFYAISIREELLCLSIELNMYIFYFITCIMYKIYIYNSTIYISILINIFRHRTSILSMKYRWKFMNMKEYYNFWFCIDRDCKMFAYVSFEDGKREIVPTNNIRHFDPTNYDKNKRYNIQWTDDHFYEGVIVLVGGKTHTVVITILLTNH